VTEDLEPKVEPKVEPKEELFDLCHLTVKDGHVVAECDSIKASEELAVLLTEDVFIRVKPTKIVTPEPEPVTDVS